jgi:glucose-6-phosphate isomerase
MILLDYSKHNQSRNDSAIVGLADEVGLKSAIADYFDGAIINQTENRAVLPLRGIQKNNKSGWS